jgi:non-heme chloroperoxidase
MLKKVLISLLLIIILVYAFVQFKANSINNGIEEYSYEQLSKQPVGSEAFVTTPDGANIRTITAGNGPIIVLAHGFGGTIRDWNLIFENLVLKGYKVIAFEQRGHNKSTFGKDSISSKSMASDYKTILEHFDVKNAILVGHSMGGFLSIKFMLDYPEIANARLKAALIMASFAGDVSKDNAQNKIQIPLIKGGYLNTIMDSKSLSTLFMASLIGKPYKAIIQTSLDNFKLQNYQKLVPILEAFVNESYYPRLSEIKIPCSIVVGTADKTTPSFHSETLATDIPNAVLSKIEGRGHLLNWESPNEIVEQIIKLAQN